MLDKPIPKPIRPPAFARDRAGRPPNLPPISDNPASRFYRGDCLTLARESCTTCGGYGYQPRPHRPVCKCVLRGICRVCLTAYKDLADRGYLAHVRYVIDPHAERTCYEMPNVDFRADFETTVRRTLTARQWRIFTLYFLSEVDWPAIAAEVGMDRGQFFHEVYRMEAKLGRRLAELEPYSLYPIGRYFAATPKGLNHAKAAA